MILMSDRDSVRIHVCVLFFREHVGNPACSQKVMLPSGHAFIAVMSMKILPW